MSFATGAVTPDIVVRDQTMVGQAATREFIATTDSWPYSPRSGSTGGRIALRRVDCTGSGRPTAGPGGRTRSSLAAHGGDPRRAPHRARGGRVVVPVDVRRRVHQPARHQRD